MQIDNVEFIIIKESETENLIHVQNVLEEKKRNKTEKNILFVYFLRNAPLFDPVTSHESSQQALVIDQEAPVINMSRCRRCGDCVRTCKENALIFDRQSDKIIILPEKCTTCKKCFFVCNKEAIYFKNYHTVTIKLEKISDHMYFAQCFCKNLEKQFKKVVAVLIKTLAWGTSPTCLILFINENQFSEILVKKISSKSLIVKTI